MADDLLRIEYEGRTYELDISDLDGREFGTLERFREQYGTGTGTIYGGLLVAKRRAGEQVTEDQILAIKWTKLVKMPEAEGDARPPAPNGTRGTSPKGSSRKTKPSASVPSGIRPG